MSEGVILGFTGSRFGLFEQQHKNLYNGLRVLKPVEVHHGDCVGADAQFHSLCVSMRPEMKIVIHPPKNERLRAFCKHGNVEIRPAKDYLARDRDIVEEASTLWGCPNSATRAASGTWSTIAIGLAARKKVMLFTPEGTMRWLSNEALDLGPTCKGCGHIREACICP